MTIRYRSGRLRSLAATAAVHTALERTTLLEGGVIPLILSRSMAPAAAVSVADPSAASG